MEIEVIYSDSDLVVINKPPGVSAHGGDTVLGPTVTDFLIQNFPEIKIVGDQPAQAGDPIVRPGIVHRLDKDTSGVMVVARNQKTFLALKELFQARHIEKKYCAIACGEIKERTRTVSFPIGRAVKNPLKRGVEQGSRKIRGAREAVTEFTILKTGKGYSYVALVPKTGRMHQLRVHMAAIHHPIACDTVYGGKNVCCPAGAKRQLLHAQSIAFSLPGGRRYAFEAEIPEDFALAVSKII